MFKKVSDQLVRLSRKGTVQYVTLLVVHVPDNKPPQGDRGVGN